jgi:MurNAc alpha-1-phosphate uridylyltransferase
VRDPLSVASADAPDLPGSHAPARPQVVVLAGGLATRLGVRTATTPKVLLPVAGRPFGHWLLERLASAGFAEALLCVGHLAEPIEASLGDGARFGLAVRYASDLDVLPPDGSTTGPRLLGTAGALRAALTQLAESFVVTYGDSYLPEPFRYLDVLDRLETSPGLGGVMAVFENDDTLDASNARLDATRTIVTEYAKRVIGSPRSPEVRFIDHGVMALRRDEVASLPLGVPLGLDKLQASLAAAGRLGAVVAPTRFHEIGSEQGLSDLDRLLSSESP